MCRTFYKKHDKCTCIYILANFTPCPSYILAHPEEEEIPKMPQDPFADPQESPTTSNPFADPEEPVSEPDTPAQADRAKLLIHTYEELNVTIDDVDYVSSDLDDSKAPKGVICPEGVITATPVGRVGGEDGECPLCETPEVLERVERIDKMRKGWLRNSDRKVETAKKAREKVKEKEKSIFHKTTRAAVKSLKNVAGGKAKKEELTSVEYASIGEGEREGSKNPEDRKKEKKKEYPATWSMYNPAGPSGYNPMWGP